MGRRKRKISDEFADIQKGTPITALYPPDGRWYAAKVIKWERNKVTVEYTPQTTIGVA